jgi:hypothetical protein
MNLNIHYQHCPHSKELDTFIKDEIQSDPLLNKDFFTSVKCFVTKEDHADQSIYKAKLIVHSKNHEDFACSLDASDPYSPWSELIKKTHHHFDKIFR